MLLLSKSTFEKCRKNGMKRILKILRIQESLKIQGNLVVPFSEKTAFLSLAEKEEENRVLPLSKSSFCWISVVCLIATNFKHSANPIAREFHPVWQMRKTTLFFSFFLEFHKLLLTSRFQISFHISPFQQSSNRNEETKYKDTNYVCVQKYQSLKHN